MTKKIIIHFIFVVSILFIVSHAKAATYYIAPDANLDGTSPSVVGRDINSGTLTAPIKTFAHAWDILKKGDTLLLLDGIYYQSIEPDINGEANPAVVDPVGSLNPAYPLDHPERTRYYITLKSQNDGKAIIDGQGKRRPVVLALNMFNTGNYFILEGFVARNSSGSVYTVLSHNVIIRRTSGFNAYLYGNDHVYTINAQGTKQNPANILLEDNFASGGGRKMFMAYNSYVNIIFRRNAGYWTAHYGGELYCGNDWPNGDNIEIYNWTQPDVPVNTILENNVALGGTPTYGINMTPNPARSISNKLLGNISMNAGHNIDGSNRTWSCSDWVPVCAAMAPYKKCSAESFGDSEWNVHRTGMSIGVFGRPYMKNNLIQDNFAWGNAGVGFVAGERSQGGTWCEGTEEAGNYPCAVCNTTDNPTEGCQVDPNKTDPNYPNKKFVVPGPSDRSSGNVLNRLTLVGNGIGMPYASTGKDTQIEMSSIDIFKKFGSVGTFYIPALGGVYANKANGARLRYRYVNGILMDGSNGQTSQELWPWPMEERIKTELAREFGIQNYSITNKVVPLLNQYTADSVPLNITVTPIPTGPTSTPLPQPSATKTPIPPTSSPKQPCPTLGDAKIGTICDGYVTINDYQLIAANFGKHPFDPGADLQPDGEIDMLDYTLVSSNFGKGSTPTQVITQGQSTELLGYWKLDEGFSGDNKSFADSSGNGLDALTHVGANGTGMNCTVTGHSGKACLFDNVDDVIDIPSTQGLHPSDAITVSAWVNVNGCSQFNSIVGHDSWNYGYWFLSYNGCRVAVNLEGVTSYQNFVTDQQVLTAGQWHHVAFTYSNAGTNNANIYVDGVLKKSLTLTGTIKYSSQGMLIGNVTPDNYPFNGSIDEVRIYNRALSPTEIQVIKNQ